MKKNAYLIPLMMMYLLYFLIAFTTGLNNPFSKVIQIQFDLSTFASQLGNFAFFIAYFAMGIPASIVVNKIGYKKASIAAVVILFSGVWVVYFGGNYELIWLYLFGMFVLGCAITIMQVIVNPMIAALGNKEGANSRMNFGGSAFAIGAILAPVVVGFIIGNAAIETLSVTDANPLLYTMAGVILMVLIVLSLVNFPRMEISQDKNEKPNYSALLSSQFIFGLVSVFLYVGVEVATQSISFLYMISVPEVGGLDIAPQVAGFVVSIYFITMLIGRLLGGVIGQKLSSRPQLIVATAITLAMFLTAILLPKTYTINLTIAGIATAVPISLLLFTGIGLFTSVMWTCIFILATDGLGKQTNMASGIFMMMVCGGGIVPVLQGKLVDNFGYVPSYWIGIVCLVTILCYALFIAKEKNK